MPSACNQGESTKHLWGTGAKYWGHWKSRNEGFRSRWKRHIVVNSMQARLRAQLGDRPKYSGERRRRSVVVASIVLTITDPLRGSYPLLCNLQAALIRSCGASFACMELTIISRFQRLQASTKSLLHSLFLLFFSAFNLSHPYHEKSSQTKINPI